MKKLIWIAALMVAAFTVQAKEVYITANEGTEWYIYNDTFSNEDGGYSFMVLSREVANEKNTGRVFIGVPFEDCAKGFGTMFIRENQREQWGVASPFRLVVRNGEKHTVADILASNICYAGEYLNKQKSTPAMKKVKG